MEEESLSHLDLHPDPMEAIDNLKKAGLEFGWVSAIGSERRTSRRREAFVMRADEMLIAFLELEAAIRLAANWLDKLA
jgi:hypothetical protein